MTCLPLTQKATNSVVAYGPKMVKPLHAGPKHQIWYMYSLGQYKHFWMGVPDFEGQGQVKGQTSLITICSHFRIHFQHKNT